MILLDRRIADRVHGSYGVPSGLVMTTGGGETLAAYIKRVTRRMDAANGPFKHLSIMAHGIERSVMCKGNNISKQSGGFGVQLASNITPKTYKELAPLASRLAKGAKVTIYACAAAEVACPPPAKASSIRQSKGHGINLMRNIARTLGATVIASDTTQEYKTIHWDPLIGGDVSIAKFGKWEGNVYAFQPGGNWRKIASNPV